MAWTSAVMRSSVGAGRLVALVIASRLTWRSSHASASARSRSGDLDGDPAVAVQAVGQLAAGRLGCRRRPLPSDVAHRGRPLPGDLAGVLDMGPGCIGDP